MRNRKNQSKTKRSKKTCYSFLNQVYREAKIEPRNRRYTPEIGFTYALAWLKGYTDAEIATAVGSSMHAVAMRRWRALKRLSRAPKWFFALVKRYNLTHILDRYAERHC